MPDELERLLRADLLAPPEGFGDRVMAAIAASPGQIPARRPGRGRQILEWLALAGAVLAGGPQLAMFLLGIWTVSGAG